MRLIESCLCAVSQVACDVVFTVKSTSSSGAAGAGSKTSSKQSEVFEVSPSRAQIPAQDHTYAVVTFSPTAMQVRCLSRSLRVCSCVSSVATPLMCDSIGSVTLACRTGDREVAGSTFARCTAR